MSNAATPKGLEPLPEAEVKEVVETWVNAWKVPRVSGACLREDEHFLNVASEWSVGDAAKKETITFSRNFSILKSSLLGGDDAKPIISSSGAITVDEKLSIPSTSRSKRAVLVEKAGTGDSTAKTEFLQIWEDTTLIKTYNLGELDLHDKPVYTSGVWGITMAWSNDDTKLAYLAEKKVPKAKPFYTSAAAPPPKKEDEDGKESKSEKEKEAASVVGEEYKYKQTWGEQLTGQYQSVIVVLDLSTDEFKVLPLPEGQFPTDIQWISNTHICGTTYPLSFWRLGLVFCSNKESIIFTIQADGENFRLITEPMKASRSPRVSPNGNFLVWQERLLDGAHHRARSIYGLGLKNGAPLEGALPQLLYSTTPETAVPVYDDFSRNCWSKDGDTLYIVTSNEAKRVCLAIPIDFSAKAKKIEGFTALLSITKDYLLVGNSSTTNGPSLSLLSIAEDYRAIPITPSTNLLNFPVENYFISGEMSPPSIYYGPSSTSVPPNSVPLIAYPHGGPHSSYVDTFDPEVLLFLKMGFAVLRLNYIGSTGGVQDTTGELLGRVGDLDVKDCQAQVERVLSSVPCLNPEKVVVFGGSHGGFLAAHLSGQFPSTYKAAVLLNAVTDLGTMVGTSDITDWVYAEAGAKLPEPPFQNIIPAARNLEDAKKFIAASPIHHAEKVQAPTLVIIGTEDLRVPAQQGIGYYRALKAHNKIAELRMYQDCHSLAKAPVHLDMVIHTALWFKRFLR